MIRRLLLGGSMALLSVTAGAQITAVRRPMVSPNLLTVTRPDVPLLLGMNSGTAVEAPDMDAAHAQLLANGYTIGRTTVAPMLARGLNGQVIAVTPGGVPERLLPLPEMHREVLDNRLTQVSSVTSVNGVLYGTSCARGEVFRYDLATGDLQTVGSKGTGVGQLSCPEGIAVDAAGRIYVGDHDRIVRMNDIGGDGWTAFGTHGYGKGQFNYIHGVAVDKKGRTYVADYFGNRVVRFDDINGAGWTEFAVREPEFIAIDRFDRLYVAVPSANSVIRIDDINGAGRKELLFTGNADIAGPHIIVPDPAPPRTSTIR